MDNHPFFIADPVTSFELADASGLPLRCVDCTVTSHLVNITLRGYSCALLCSPPLAVCLYICVYFCDWLFVEKKMFTLARARC